MKWLWSFLAFVFTTIFVTAITTNFFISSIESGYDDAKAETSKQVDLFATQSIAIIYTQNPDLKETITALNALPADLRKQTLEEQCKDKLDQPFCDPDFISGKRTFDEILKKKTKEQLEPSFLQALDDVKNQLAVFNKFPLVLLSIISAVFGIIFYVLAKDLFNGVQIFIGNVSWLSFLSAISFKLMPNVLSKAIANMQQNLPAGSEAVSEIMKNILLSWLTPAISEAFTASLWIAGISFVVWAIMKIFRKYEFVQN